MIAALSFGILTTADTCKAEKDCKVVDLPADWQGYATAFHLLLPVAGFLVIWGRRDIFNKFLLHIDRSGVSVLFPSFSQRQKLLRWTVENLSTTWSSTSKNLPSGIPDLWKDGSLLCTLINIAVPGACHNPPKHWKKPPTHAQALAFKYLGIPPVFSESDFEEPFTPQQEKKFLQYLQDLQKAIKTRCSRETVNKFTQNYLAKGMGLQNGEQHKKSTFYVYSNSTSSNCSNVIVYIRGPFGTQGTATIPAFYNQSQPLLGSLKNQQRSFDKIVFKKEPRKSFLMSIASDISSLVNRKQTSNDIPINIEMETNRAKVTFIPLNYGVYELELITNGVLLMNSPYTISVSENISGVKDTLDSDDEYMHNLPSFRRRKIVKRFIDCINEKIILDNEDCEMSSASEESGFGSLLETSVSEVIEDSKTVDEDSNEEKTKNNKTVMFANQLPEVTVSDHSEDEKIEESSGPEESKTEVIRTDTETYGRALKLSDVEEMKVDVQAEPTTLKNETEDAALEEETLKSDLKEFCEDRVQKRPTSIVTPFLITPNFGEKTNGENKEEEEQRYESENLGGFEGKSVDSLTEKNKTNSVDRLRSILIEKLSCSDNTKTIKNFVNTSKKLKRMSNVVETDANNNDLHETLRDTSAIFPADIVQEVETASTRPVESRRPLVRQTCVSVCSSKNSSFSETENEEVSKSSDENYSLKLLSVIDTIRNSASRSLNRTISNSTPNISTTKSIGSTSEETQDYRSTFAEVRDYWLNLSNSSKKAQSQKMEAGNTLRTFREKFRSSEDIALVSRYNSSNRLRKCCSLNQKDFETIDFVSLESRKKKLLRDLYDRESMGTRFIKKHVFSRTKSEEIFREVPEEKEKSDVFFGKRENRCFIETSTVAVDNIKNLENYPREMRTVSIKAKPFTQFRTAFTFFKNLEKSNDKQKNVMKMKHQIKRTFSLDSFEYRRDKPQFGGSLHLPKNLEKSIAKIYRSNLGDKIPENNADVHFQEARSNFFVNKEKLRRRKSLKSIFDIVY